MPVRWRPPAARISPPKTRPGQNRGDEHRMTLSRRSWGSCLTRCPNSLLSTSRYYLPMTWALWLIGNAGVPSPGMVKKWERKSVFLKYFCLKYWTVVFCLRPYWSTKVLLSFSAQGLKCGLISLTSKVSSVFLPKATWPVLSCRQFVQQCSASNWRYQPRTNALRQGWHDNIVNHDQYDTYGYKKL